MGLPVSVANIAYKVDYIDVCISSFHAAEGEKHCWKTHSLVS